MSRPRAQPTGNGKDASGRVATAEGARLSDKRILENMDWCMETARSAREANEGSPEFLSRYQVLGAICAELIWLRRFLRK